jgi:hypothetical protein
MPTQVFWSASADERTISTFAKFNQISPWGQTFGSSIDARDIHLGSDCISSPNKASFTHKSQKLYFSSAERCFYFQYSVLSTQCSSSLVLITNQSIGNKSYKFIAGGLVTERIFSLVSTVLTLFNYIPAKLGCSS